MSKEQLMAKKIASKIGGVGNASKIYNCMTRVRIDLLDSDKVEVDSLKSIEGVMGVVEDGNNLQVIVGPGASNKVAAELNALAGVQHTEQINENLDPNLTNGQADVKQKAASNKAAFKQQQKDNQFKRFTRVIASIFVPLIPAFVGAGIIGGIASILNNLIVAGEISEANWGQILTVLNILKNGLFAYLNIYVGINAAKVFGATEGLGGVVAGVIYLNGMSAEAPLMNIFSGQPLSPGQGGMIGVILAVYLLSIMEKQLRKVIPNSLDIILTTSLSLLATGLITIFLIMPLAGVVSSSLVGSINWVLEVGGAFAGFVLGATFLPLVMFGLHQVLTPVHVEMISSSGATYLLPILAMAGAGQVGAALALWLKARKNKQLTSMIKGALPVGILGIGEPLIYAVTLPLGRPFITACLGGGVGGAVIGALGNIGATAIGPSGVTLIPLITEGHRMGYIYGLLAAYAGGFILTYLFGVPHEATLPTEIHGSSSNLDVNEMLNNL
ncbi:PTS transporter subunit EIIC [Facklamia sp. 7083-14-GEN3]|uniref:PTS transporter subunit EIIC n=1 Tax=Facklamia sp. 7083-14-GEN3 TaxID=2973478 RepID=UPI00215B92A6|nr:PTS transporter subunit EIIC [Facklamia sp. 7083-14-GEN3]MCR8968587.1 PTS transporter subunit EIIC [Facklamia sp. 7083-14-GEN3]